MNTKPEQILETILDLERSRRQERTLRVESEALLEGLRGITEARETEVLFQGLVKVLHSLIEFDDAFILKLGVDGVMVPLASSSGRQNGTSWQPQSVFRRVLTGRPIAVFDVEQVPEWMEQPAAVRENITSALHIGLHGGNQTAILVVTHPEPKKFGPSQVKQAERFAPLASQALLTLDLQQAVTQRDRFFELSLDLMAIVTFDGQFRQHNDAWRRVLDHDEEELQNLALVEIVHVDDRQAFSFDLRQAREKGENLLREYRFSCRDGSFRWLSCSLAAYANEQLYYIVARDVTDRVLAEHQLARDAHHDALTGLFNRYVFTERLQKAVAHVHRNKQAAFAVLYLDLNRFKIINDSLGHNVGDELLKEVALRLAGTVREEDTVARFGGDEFVILLMDVVQPQGAAHAARRIHESLAAPMVLLGNEISTSASIGLTLSTLGYRNAEDVLRDADTAMYVAKSDKKQQYVVFDPAMHTKAMSHLQVETDLRQAIEKGEMVLFYQPVISSGSGGIVSFEALLRWRHPTRGLVSPLEFIPIAEECGLIIPIGEWVLGEACRQLQQWSLGYPRYKDLKINVNISVRQFWDKGFLEKVTGIVGRSGVEPERVILEITESVLMHNAKEATKLFMSLKDHGFKLYIDDFGTGYSSLSYLHRFPFDGIKIDRSFISLMESDMTSRELVNIILLLANNLGLQAVAEGVETQSELERLSAMGCDHIQGFFYSKPLPAEEACLLLAGV